MVTTRNASFQQWQSYLGNRAKRTRAGRFLVQGVRPLNMAVEYDWPIETLLHRIDGAPLSEWARGVLRAHPARQVGISSELIGELGEKEDSVPELIGVAETRAPRLRDLELQRSPLIVAFDRPSSPGNLGTLIRSADAFGADAVVVVGHGADPFDPQSVRASTGSVFARPVATVPSVDDVVRFRDDCARAGGRMDIVGTDETGSRDIAQHDFTGGTVLVVGNETRGMSAAWHAACDAVVRIPIGGSASSLGAPSAGAVALYEIARQRNGGAQR
nr:TrmH family RNA methyltransferase [Rhodococcus triatomae]